MLAWSNSIPMPSHDKKHQLHIINYKRKNDNMLQVNSVSESLYKCFNFKAELIQPVHGKQRILKHVLISLHQLFKRKLHKFCKRKSIWELAGFWWNMKTHVSESISYNLVNYYLDSPKRHLRFCQIHETTSLPAKWIKKLICGKPKIKSETWQKSIYIQQFLISVKQHKTLNKYIKMFLVAHRESS